MKVCSLAILDNEGGISSRLFSTAHKARAWVNAQCTEGDAEWHGSDDAATAYVEELETTFFLSVLVVDHGE